MARARPRRASFLDDAMRRAATPMSAIRGQRPGEDPVAARPIKGYADFSSHNAWGTDHFGFLYQGDLEAFCAKLRGKGVSFPVELKRGVNGGLLCYVAAPDGVSIELMQC
jgi:catechol 2,3-dioxygenase-like lactoylglutathione lyase family enzyme